MEQAPSKEPQPEQPAGDSGRVRALGSTQSDANGRYRIEGLPPDRVYEVVVWIAPEYRSALTDRGHASIRVRDVRAGARGVDFRLEKIGLEELSPLR
jgi:hypothetical protein